MEFAISSTLANKKHSVIETVQVVPTHLPSLFNKANNSYDSGFHSSNENLDKNGISNKSVFALHQSILDGRLKQVSYFLKMGINVNSKDIYGRTSLMIACLCDFEDYGIQVAKLLLRYGADLNVKDSRGQSVIYIACTEKRENFFDFLMDNHSISIDLKQKDNDGKVL